MKIKDLKTKFNMALIVNQIFRALKVRANGMKEIFQNSKMKKT